MTLPATIVANDSGHISAHNTIHDIINDEPVSTAIGVRLNGVNNAIVTTPYVAARTPQSLYIEIDLAVDDYSNGIQRIFSAYDSTTTATRDFSVAFDPTGKLNFNWWTNTSGTNISTSTTAPLPVAAGERCTIATWLEAAANPYQLHFYFASFGESLTEIELVQGTAATAINDGNTQYLISGRNGGGADRLAGTVYAISVRNGGPTGTLAATFDPSGITIVSPTSPATVTASTGEVWTLGSLATWSATNVFTPAAYASTSDPLSVGTADPGTNTAYSRSDHVHDGATVEQVAGAVASAQAYTDSKLAGIHTPAWSPKINDLLTSTFDPAAIQGSVVPTDGQVRMIRVPVPEDMVVSGIKVIVATAGSGLDSGQCFSGLYSFPGARLALTADQAAVWNSTGEKLMTITPTLLSGGPDVYAYVPLLANGTTPPAFARGASSVGINAGLVAANGFRWGHVTGTATSLASTITIGTLTADTDAVWVGLVGTTGTAGVIDHGEDVTFSNVGCTSADGTDLTDLTIPASNYTITTAGRLIENSWIGSNVIVRAANVTLRNCRIDGYVLNYYGGVTYSGLVLENCDIGFDRDGTLPSTLRNNGLPAISTASYTALRCRIAGHVDGLRTNGGVLVEECWVRTFFQSGGHHDAMQDDRGVGDVTIRRCNMDANFYTSDTVQGPGYGNACWQDSLSTTGSGHITFVDNLFAGGNNTLNISQSTGTYTITGNKFVRSSYQYNTHSIYDDSRITAWSDNTFSDNGEVIAQ